MAYGGCTILEIIMPVSFKSGMDNLTKPRAYQKDF